jgi:DNA-binding NtrC family response regulator
MAELPKPRARILVVEDEPSARNALVVLLGDQYEVEAVETAEAAEQRLHAFLPDVLLTDIRLPGMSGMDLIPRVRAAIPECVVLVMTGYSSIETAVQAMRAGARDFIVKPLNLDAVELVLQRELEAQANALTVKHLREQLGQRVRDSEVWAESPQMRDVMRLATEVAGSMATVLIRGESGTGKEVVARYLHRRSSRSEGAFVAVNCGAIPETLLESEFFGHEKGAFTGAVARREGRFERADGGTIFLDEIGELPVALQVKLLRVLQERQFERVGGSEPIKVDVRVIAATNRDLELMLREGRFREDLYYRLNVFELRVPPLRDRKSDAGGLWARFVERFARREGLEPPTTTPAAFNALYAYEWPGNVRELENAAERAVILSRGLQIEPHHLPPAVRTFADAEHGKLEIPGVTLADIEKMAILKTLAAVDGNTAKAADMLGISVRKIQYRLKEWREAAQAP